MQNLTSRNTRL